MARPDWPVHLTQERQPRENLGTSRPISPIKLLCAYLDDSSLAQRTLIVYAESVKSWFILRDETFIIIHLRAFRHEIQPKVASSAAAGYYPPP